MISLICTWTNGWANRRYAGDLIRHCAHYDATVTKSLIHWPGFQKQCPWHTLLHRPDHSYLTWAPRSLKSPSTPLFVQQLVKDNSGNTNESTDELPSHRSLIQKAFRCHDVFKQRERIQTRTTRTPALWEIPPPPPPPHTHTHTHTHTHRHVFTHSSDLHQIPNQNKTKSKSQI